MVLRGEMGAAAYRYELLEYTMNRFIAMDAIDMSKFFHRSIDSTDTTILPLPPIVPNLPTPPF